MNTSNTILDAGEARVSFNTAVPEFAFNGSMRLANMGEYEVVSDFLQEQSKNLQGPLVLDFSGLQFLNSAGITTISLFILSCKKQGNKSLVVRGNAEVSWQQKSLANFKKLWTDLLLEL